MIEETIKCIREEGFAAASTRHIVERAGVSWGVIQYHFGDRDGLLTAVGRAHDRGVEWLWLREGPSGSRLYGPDGKVRHIPAYRGEVVDVTGAGDAMLAGYLHALGQGADPAAAAEYGAAAAALTIASPQPVRPDLDAALLTRTVTPARERGHS